MPPVTGVEVPSPADLRQRDVVARLKLNAPPTLMMSGLNTMIAISDATVVPRYLILE